MKNFKKYISVFFLSANVLSACTKSFQDINTNPNSPVDAPATNVLAWVLENFAADFYGDWVMSEPETYAGHIGKIQYVDESRYMYSDATVTTRWNNLFHIAVNAQEVIDEAQKSNTVNMQAVAMTMEAFVMWLGTDTWRDMPYAQAIKGDSGYVTPQYDTQEKIYPAIISQLNAAADLFAKGADDKLGVGDLLFGGNIIQWQKFCNSLRLRMAIRISGIDAIDAKTMIEGIMNDPADYPIIMDNSDNAYFYWQSATPYQEPWYVNSKTRDDHGAGQPLVDTLKMLADPRLEVYVKPASTDNAYRGMEIGVPGVPTNIGQYSRIGARFRDNPTGFTPFINASEVSFLLAEATVNGWDTKGNAKQYYENGINLSMQENGITDEDVIGKYISSNKVSWNGSLTRLYEQKWLALFKNGNEAWAEERRTDYPLLPAAPGSPYAGHSRPPFRYAYPSTETTLNGTNSSSYIKEAADNFWGKKMWWDTRSGIQ